VLCRGYLFCKWYGLKWDRSWRFLGLFPIIRKSNGAVINICINFTCNSDPRKNTYGIIQRVLIYAGRPETIIEIGDRVGISGCTISAIERITIGNDVLIGTGAIIADHDAHGIEADSRGTSESIRHKEIKIGNNVLVGARSIILKGVTIGDGSVIGAGSVVIEDVPPNAVVRGNPAKVIRFINQ